MIYKDSKKLYKSFNPKGYLYDFLLLLFNLYMSG